MSKDEMILALDRISRFKFPEKKLKRVYIETICAHLLPAYKKNDIQTLNNQRLTEIFTNVWNYSVFYNFKKTEEDFSLNENYINEEKKCYQLTCEILSLMPEGCDFKTLLENTEKKYIPNNFLNYKTPSKIVLTEGVTEEILIPEFLKINNIENNINIKVVGTGGKSRIINKYNEYKRQLKIPIYILLDLDAQSVYSSLKLNLRPQDKTHLISCGEIEDIIPKNLFKYAINSEFKLQSKVSVNDFNKNISMVENLHNIFKEKGFGEFKKAKMANLIKNIINKNTVLSEELAKILEEIET